MFRIAKEFHFSASHQLTHLPAEHQCARLHGHNYVVVVELESATIDPQTGFVLDYAALGPIKDYIDTKLDHRHLNDVFGGSVATTAENLAAALHGVFRTLIPHSISAVRVCETPKTVAEFRP